MALPLGIQKTVGRQAQNLLVTGQRFTRFDQIRQRHFWSTYRLNSDANGYLKPGDFDVFQTPPGQAGQGFPVPLTQKETNWPSANRVPDNQNFEVTELGVTIVGVNIKEQGEQNVSPYNMAGVFGTLESQILQNLRVSITYLTNSVPLGMATDFAQASGPALGDYTVASQGDAAAAFTTNGFAAPGLRRRFKIPLLLQHGETFRFTLSVDQGRQPFLGGILFDETATELAYADIRLDFWATESFVEKS